MTTATLTATPADRDNLMKRGVHWLDARGKAPGSRRWSLALSYSGLSALRYWPMQSGANACLTDHVQNAPITPATLSRQAVTRPLTLTRPTPCAVWKKSKTRSRLSCSVCAKPRTRQSLTNSWTIAPAKARSPILKATLSTPKSNKRGLWPSLPSTSPAAPCPSPQNGAAPLLSYPTFRNT